MKVSKMSDHHSFFSRLRQVKVHPGTTSACDQFLLMLAAVVGVPEAMPEHKVAIPTYELVMKLNARLPKRLKCLLRLRECFSHGPCGRQLYHSPSFTHQHLRAALVEVEKLAAKADHLPALQLLGRLGLRLNRVNELTLLAGIRGASAIAYRVGYLAGGKAEQVTADMVRGVLQRFHDREVLRFALDESCPEHELFGSCPDEPGKREALLAEIVADIREWMTVRWRNDADQLTAWCLSSCDLLPTDCERLNANPCGESVSVSCPIPGAMEAINRLFAQSAAEVASGASAAADGERRQAQLLRHLRGAAPLARLVAGALRAGLAEAMRRAAAEADDSEYVRLEPPKFEVDHRVFRESAGCARISLTETARAVTAFKVAGRDFRLVEGEEPSKTDYISLSCMVEVSLAADGSRAKCVFHEPPVLHFHLSDRFRPV